MLAIAWRLAALFVCFLLFMFPLVNVLTVWLWLPLGIYCLVSVTARIWKRNSDAVELHG